MNGTAYLFQWLNFDKSLALPLINFPVYFIWFYAGRFYVFYAFHNCQFTHDIYESFDCDPPVDIRGNFLHVSKAFGKFWHDGLVLRLQTYSIDVAQNLLKLFKI